MKKEMFPSIWKDSDMFLIGIGEDFEEQGYLMENPDYASVCQKVAKAGMQWVIPYVNRVFLEENEKLCKAYQALQDILKGKNYFAVSVCMNGFLKESGLKQDRYVEPCGSYTVMQCKKGCAGSLKETPQELLQEIRLCCCGEKAWEELEPFVCKECGEPLVFNSLYSEHYLEEGYLDKWAVYTKWLQGTVNKKLCILELGAGMRFAGVIRFRFEKIAGLNQKAHLVRVHKNLYPVPEEISGKSIGISQNAVEFMAEITEL